MSIGLKFFKDKIDNKISQEIMIVIKIQIYHVSMIFY
jgi:hypothetical protein